ncbi:uncharacterized protein C16orf46-like isoform X2 [Scyliorhinus canicula]|nr:uncharacterized protein C16orf46-like isoform X2 [Scyliorhinus canicula]XP_038662196.1 uncharacterized protein C16orf46-like isoform X2 [Scyliorhinus canicula]XP_038662197.1 uncharacterized protein C16orf46-like isoform X2 [Scyliorhinus canicula]
MELQEEGMVDRKRIAFSNTLESNNEMALSPTHFLHSWESERKLIEVLIKVSEKTYEDDQKQMDQIIIYNGWDDAVHGWRRDISSYSFHTLKKSKKSRREEKNGSNCVFCAEMLPTSERKTVQGVGQPGRSSKSSDSTVAPIFTGKITNSFAERTTPPVSQTKYSSAASQRYTSELTQESCVQDNKAETEVNPSQETECEVTHTPHQPTPVKKHFSVLPPVKMASGDEMFVSGFKAGRMFCLGNRDLQTVSVVSKHDDKDNLRIRAHGCNMAMLQVSKIQKAETPVPFGLTRIPYMNAMGHWCWQYSLMQGHENLAINGAPASKVMECGSIRVQPSKIIKQHTKHLKQDNFSKSTFSHSSPSNKHLSRIRQRNVAASALLRGIPQPGTPLLSGTSIPISILPH